MLKRFSLLWGFILFSYAMPGIAAAKEGPANLSVLPVISSLFLVIVTILILALVYKKLNLGFPGSRSIKVVSALSLGTKERVVVIEVNGKQHMLGVTSHQVNHLFTLDEPLDEGSGMKQNQGQTPMTFQKIFENLGKKHD